MGTAIASHKSNRLAGLAADDAGSSDQRPPLVLLHGLSFSRRIWAPILDALDCIDVGRRVVSLDLPGHGESPGWAAYEVETLADGVHRAVEEAQLKSPVIVGHSMSAIIATVYAARYETRGVVNVDQALQPAPFARLVQSLADQLRGRDFPALWERFIASMHIEKLPPSAQDLVCSISTPRQDLVIGYWRDLLHRSPEELSEWMNGVVARLRATRVPYLIVSGHELEPDYLRWLREVLPQSIVATWPASGHFPHLVHPGRFAELLAAASSPV
jgi:pimeloyl-ACP methyl ester carboxylesterase